ncbi:cytochrome P450 [Sphaerisporangium rufum]|uniref:Cytochrome P450 n=1 Tax=Sphaerisporangium rufum TaxID=1381558 RepID=A0A919V091_9ACTN|nr:cytochrome P450 [Sphaerisporangium rufum]GII76438.1 cytochrome P450 [Sphaerisporangium rufum]
MPQTMPSRAAFPQARQDPPGPPPRSRQWREEDPVRPLVYADGRAGWLVTGAAAARAVLADPRFGAEPARPHPPAGDRITRRLLAEVPGFFREKDPAEHTRLRRLVDGRFTPRHLRALEPRIAEIARDRLDAMAGAGPPADLVREFTLPVPSLVICELLGVPRAEHERFQRCTADLIAPSVPPERARAALDELMGMLRELVVVRRATPGDDLISHLVATRQLTKDEITGMAMLLLVAGQEITANMLALGVFTLLRDPARLAALRDDPSPAAHAVEELLRHLTIVHAGPVRAAREDVELDGHLIRAGETVTVSLAAAGHFTGQDGLDVLRRPSGQMGFGHGVHQGLGRQLARTEMRIAYPMLLRRFHGLRLVTVPGQVPTRDGMAILGVHALPVAW